MSRNQPSRQSYQDPNDPDAILPAGFVPLHSTVAPPRRPPQPFRGATQATLLELLDEIVKWCQSRGEMAEAWGKSVKERINPAPSTLDLNETATGLRRILDRLHRGEFLCFFNESVKRFDLVNQEFALDKVLVHKGQAVKIAAPVRPAPRSLETVLPAKTYVNVWWSRTFWTGRPTLTVGEVDDALRAIASRHKVLFSRSRGDAASIAADTWLRDAQAKWGSAGGRLWHLQFRDSMTLRANLIIVADAMRTDGALPDLTVDWEKTRVSPPQNRASASRSLARISRRHASLIGYHGREAQDGGLEFHGPAF